MATGSVRATNARSVLKGAQDIRLSIDSATGWGPMYCGTEGFQLSLPCKPKSVRVPSVPDGFVRMDGCLVTAIGSSFTQWIPRQTRRRPTIFIHFVFSTTRDAIVCMVWYGRLEFDIGN